MFYDPDGITKVIVGNREYVVAEDGPEDTYKVEVEEGHSPNSRGGYTSPLQEALGSHLVLTPNKYEDPTRDDTRSVLLIPLGPGVIVEMKRSTY